MKAVFVAAVAILGAGFATSAIADGDDAGGAMPVVSADSGGSGDGWGVASSAGVTYADSPASPDGALTDAASGHDVAQNYEFLDPNVLEYTQLVAGGAVVTLSGVLLQRDGDDSDAAQLDEQASGVYSSGSAALVPSLYDAASTLVATAGNAVSCVSGCDVPLSEGDGGAVKSLASYASSSTSNPLSSSPYTSVGAFSLGGTSVPDPSPLIPPLPPVILIPPISEGGGPGGGTGGQPQPPPSPPAGGQGNGGGLGLPIAAPEPAAWTLMIIGFGAIGAAGRRRPRPRTLA